MSLWAAVDERVIHPVPAQYSEGAIRPMKLRVVELSARPPMVDAPAAKENFRVVESQ